MAYLRRRVALQGLGLLTLSGLCPKILRAEPAHGNGASDVVVVGAGAAGFAAAIAAREAGADRVLIVEKMALAGGQIGRAHV